MQVVGAQAGTEPGEAALRTRRAEAIATDIPNGVAGRAPPQAHTRWS